ncbi:sensor histidine kinase [Mycolicibacterium aichiense]|uniref:histidine kinase n=1 Tax=Mycolicibacterium aichiense TaxID=1799 RepID=A0AAD1MDW7_9MYCO|nr:HAMP domain-containing sensor histidine kinase [Mycolicibacterium aichiense]MCV7017570.1 HAMP domain-containing histidine kinase [Mycolicibacterium aichiense]BBX09331.1 two-component sensor histidine kinase [Mycolicibacterium aichiense]SUA13897.1 two component sensor histidine kinase trcs [Mycolicibacterium aichiense]
MTASKRWWRRRSLRRQLAIGVSSIVSVALIVVGTVAVISLRDEAIRLSDTQVANSLAAFSYAYAKWDAQRTIAPDATGMPMGRASAFQNQAPGTAIAVVRDGAVVYSNVFADGAQLPAPADAQRAMEAVNWADSGPRTVQLGELGPYRADSRDVGAGERLVAAVSLRPAEKTVAHETLIVVILVVLALLATGIGTVWTVSHALKPLRRIAAVAGEVATLRLDGTETRITARVDESDTDPESDVGVVGHALNRLLINVDSALADLAASDRRMRQFLADASHELRTPLASILGYAELTRQDSATLPETTEYALARIEAESRRMSVLVADLLLLSRLEERNDLDIEDVELCDLVADAVNDAAVSAPDHHFHLELPDHQVRIRGDRARLHQVLANLLANARIHTPAGVNVTAAVGIAPGDPATVKMVVSDDGPGIPPEVIPNLFDRFVRADKARARESGSSGLGLAIVRSIVQAHGGTVEVESKPGNTRFTVSIPLHSPSPQDLNFL